jgi:hypothetical protein
MSRILLSDERGYFQKAATILGIRVDSSAMYEMSGQALEKAETAKECRSQLICNVNEIDDM